MLIPRKVVTICRHLNSDGAPINSATCSRAVWITDFSFDPNLYALDGLPHSVVRYGIIASSTSGSMGVVALWSR